ncbi:hypothetical protein J6590_091660 [Homalodisca vitripennis]|nr:hypothetical protein J6590_091660 [Homalodisca vitripennis]
MLILLSELCSGICSGAVCVPPHRSAYHYLPSARAIPATVLSSLTVSPYGGSDTRPISLASRTDLTGEKGRSAGLSGSTNQSA